MINENGRIVQLGQIIFNYNNEILKVKSGDIINYNFQNSRLYQVVRNAVIIYENDAIINNPKLQKDFLKYANGPCNDLEN